MDLIYELDNVLKQVSGDSFAGLQAVYHAKTGRIELVYAAKTHQPPARVLSIRNRFNRPSCPVHVQIHQGQHASDLFSDPKLLSDWVRDLCALCEPFSVPFLKSWDAYLNGDRLVISLADPNDVQLFCKLDLPAQLKKYFEDVYDRSLEIEVHSGCTQTEEYEPPEVTRFVPENDTVPERPAPPPVPAAPKAEPLPAPAAKKPAAPRRRTAPGPCPLTRIADLQPDAKVTIDAQIITSTAEEKRGGEFVVHKYVLCDKTGTITGTFLSSARNRKDFEMPKDGSWVQVTGTYEFDKYEHENVLKIRDAAASEHRDRCDDAQSKRIELHAHTKMSAMDAVTDIGALISRAAKWGHEAIAITDHGVGQAFPIAASAAKKAGIKIIYGMEGYMFDDEIHVFSDVAGDELPETMVVFTLLTTDRVPLCADLLAISAVRVSDRGFEDRFHSYVRSDKELTAALLSGGNLREEDIRNAPDLEAVLRAFSEFVGDSPAASALGHDEMCFLLSKGAPYGFSFAGGRVDLDRLCRIAFPDLTTYKHKTMAQTLKISVPTEPGEHLLAGRLAHHALSELRRRGEDTMAKAQALCTPQTLYRGMKTHHIIILCRNKPGMSDLNRLISESHINYLDRKKPKLPKSLLAKYRSNLIVGSACESGDLYRALVQDAPEEELVRRASFYDYLEIQPVGNNMFLVRQGSLSGPEDIRDLNRAVVSLGERLDIPVAATCDVHFLEPEDECYRRLLQHSMGFEPGPQSPLFFRTTEEMMGEFEYLGEEKAEEVVCQVPAQIASQVEQFPLLPDETLMPVIDDAAEKIERMAYETAKSIYGDPLPEIVSARLARELDSIIRNGFSVLYYSAHLLVKKSNEDGYLVGSRGSVGSSLAATMTGITEVNPLPPHYVCPNCRHSDFDVDLELYDCGPDLPDRDCPLCGTAMRKEGYNIPFEVFLGIDADKVPDIDLNFSGEYQAKAHAYTEVIFGKGNVYRAGTILSLKDKNARAYVRAYLDDTGTKATRAETARLSKGLEDVKKSTGKHPGGMVIVPRGHEIYEFTAVQWPANKPEDGFVTTHYGFDSMHDILVKLDILGHDGPTIMRRIQDITGIDPLTIPLADPQVLALFSGLEPLGIQAEDLFGINIGTLGIPEFGTNFVREMLKETQPKTVAEIVRISGLSHGTDVWLGNAQTLIKEGVVKLSEAICARDDIMNYLSARGVEKRMAFHIMEDTRKGKVARNGFKDDQADALREAEIPAWFIESCRKIKYMFPKGHAVAYSLLSLRIAYIKLYEMNAFYATFFDVHAGDFNVQFVEDGLAGIRRHYEALSAKGMDASDLDKKALYVLQLACEMYLRGGKFLPIDLMKSDPVRFQVEEDGIRIPFTAIPQLGEKVARNIAAEREKKPFLSIEDLERRAHVSSSLTGQMKKMGILNGLPQSNQLSLFDVF